MKNFKEYIMADELTLVDFYATWCGPCRAMQPILAEYKKLMGGKIRVLKLDIDSPANARKVAELGIRSVPTLVFFRRGEVVWRGSGVIPLAELQKITESLRAQG